MKFHDALSRVAWQDFEVLVANYYRDQGYDVAHCGDGQFGFRAGGEVDLRMRKDGKLTLVHCRHESVSRINAEAVERLIATGAEDGAAEVIVVSSADIPDAARQAGEKGGATLVDGVAVRAMLGERLVDLHPARAPSDPNGEAHIVIRGGMPNSRGRRGWNLPVARPAPSARRKRRPLRWLVIVLAITVLGLAWYFAPALKRLAHRDPAPPTPTIQELPLPAN
jgi:hypothetical protein